MKQIPNLEYEQKYWNQNKEIVIGIDEVGRGSLAGPIVAGAVAFAPDHQPIEGVNDSKKLTAEVREKLAIEIRRQALYWQIGMGNISLINNQGIMPATIHAMTQALSKQKKFDMLLIDGRPIKNFPIKANKIKYIVKGDAKSYSIAAASIIAKVFRDQLMIDLTKQFPQYSWQNNMGYGTL